jgi:hypothetical protein
MTESDKGWLAGYLRDLADRMGLKDWTIEVLADLCDDDSHADIRCIEGRKLAKVRFARDWREQTPETQRHTCCHELIHCHFAAVHLDTLRKLKSVDGETFMMHLEYGIDGMADAIAPHMPLPLAIKKAD